MRERLWRVDRVDGDTFAATPLDGRDQSRQRFHSLIETVESGSMPFPSATSVGDQRAQKLLLDAHRFSILHGTAPILGLQRSRAIPTDFQLAPLLMALGQDRVRLLIADDVGTGKTIEAGLVVSELQARGVAKRILVVVPAALRDQWKEALDHFFHIDSTVVAGHLLPALERRLLPGQSVWSSHDVVIASVDYLKTRTEHVLSRPWDLVVIDEAHLCAKPHTLSAQDEPDMARWQFARRAAEHARHLLLLTATPHNGYTDSYASLLSMLDPSLVEHRGDTVSVRRNAARSHVVQRRRADIEEWYRERGKRSPFPERRSDEDIVDLTRASETRHLLDGLSGYAEELYGASSSRPLNGWIAAHLQKRALSSPEAIRRSLANRQAAVRRSMTASSDKKATDEAKAAVADLHESGETLDEGRVDRLDRAASTLGAERELDYLDDLIDRAKKVTPAKDPKLKKLLELIPTRLAEHPDVRRVMVFTKFKDTLDYLVKEVGKAAKSTAKTRTLPDGTEVFAIHGDLTLAERRRMFAEFERAPVAVLVATDCISEGLNLQHACAELIHYELPWNPNRIEQRNGRVDRFHQREPFVGIRTLVLDDPLDRALLELILVKANRMRAEYGFVPPFLANADILAHLASRGRQLLNQPTLFDSADIEDTFGEGDILDHEQLGRIRDESFYGHADISLTLVEEALERSRDEIGTPEAVEGFFRLTLAELGITAAKTADGLIILSGSSDDVADVLPAAGTRLTFDAEVGFADPDVEIVDLAHPLVRRLIEIVKDRSQLPDCTGRVAGRITAVATETTGVAHVLARYVARGEPPVLLEELVDVAVPVWGNGAAADPFALMSAAVASGTKTADDIREDAADLLARVDLTSRIEAAVQARSAGLAARHEALDAQWAAGLSDVEVMSWDLIAVTVVYPEVAR